jgi:drug/metabolite transporter (DMT)-like permease
MYIPDALGWNMDDVPWDLQQFFLILFLALILVGIGFIGLWRKSGNVIPLVSAIFIILWDITYDLLWYLETFTLWLLGGPLHPADVTGIATIIAGVGWIAAGISAWLLRDEFSPFSIVAALVFLAFGAVHIGMGLLDPSMMLPPQDWWYWFFSATGIVTGIYFLDAART